MLFQTPYKKNGIILVQGCGNCYFVDNEQCFIFLRDSQTREPRKRTRKLPPARSEAKNIYGNLLLCYPYEKEENACSRVISSSVHWGHCESASFSSLLFQRIKVLKSVAFTLVPWRRVQCLVFNAEEWAQCLAMHVVQSHWKPRTLVLKLVIFSSLTSWVTNQSLSLAQN